VPQFCLVTATVLVAATAPLAAQPAPRSAQRAEMIVTNARIYTADDAQPLAEAMAISGGRLQFVGSAVEAMALRRPATELVDVAGAADLGGWRPAV